MYTYHDQDIIHTSSFDEWGFCPSCGLDDATCECPGPADVHMNGSVFAASDIFGTEKADD